MLKGPELTMLHNNAHSLSRFLSAQHCMEDFCLFTYFAKNRNRFMDTENRLSLPEENEDSGTG